MRLLELSLFFSCFETLVASLNWILFMLQLPTRIFAPAFAILVALLAGITTATINSLCYIQHCVAKGRQKTRTSHSNNHCADVTATTTYVALTTSRDVS